MNNKDVDSIIKESFKRIKFHTDPIIDKKIKILMLWFDNKVITMGLNFKQTIRLYNVFIAKFSKFEEYEMANSFRNKKWNYQKVDRRARRDITLYLVYRLYKKKITKLLRKSLRKQVDS